MAAVQVSSGGVVVADRLAKLQKLPVLGICGADVQQRQAFAGTLLRYLQEHGCSARLFSGGHCQSHDSLKKLQQQALVHDALLVEGPGPSPFHHVVVQKDRSIIPGWHSTHPLSQSDALEFARLQLEHAWLQSPLWGCVLIGGKSRRMGSPKHLIVEHGVTWVERSVQLLSSLTDRIVISGAGALPQPLKNMQQIEDEPGLGGPIAGVLSVMRHNPEVSWLVAACDLPDMRIEALQWLLEQRKMGIHAVMPDMEGKGRETSIGRRM
ncbi:MAG: hypothetical protein CSA26_10510 [Desulfobacterales bacterium]|nr:MAG: hypothetical protein CSA26_10510 [Desulfobacterales bacterium]